PGQACWFYKTFMSTATIPDRKFIATPLFARLNSCLARVRSMPLADLRASNEKRAALHRRSTIVADIVASAGATLGISAERKPSPQRPAFIDTIAAVVIATLALAVFLCLAAISPVVWTFAGDAAWQLRGELSQCSSIEESCSRVACYHEI